MIIKEIAMALSKTTLTLVKKISNLDIDVKKTYHMERKILHVFSKKRKAPIYSAWDDKITLSDRDIPVRIFTPDVLTSQGVLLFFHGGGWVTGSLDSYNRICTELAEQTGQKVVSVEYRLAPEHRFPAALEDCYAAARELFLSQSPIPAAPEEITLIGDSAGGNLAAAVSLMSRDRGEFYPRRQILIYPVTGSDHSSQSPFPSMKENGEDYLLTAKRMRDFTDLYASSPEDKTHPYFAPLLAENLSHQPDTLIITAEFCPLRDEGEAYGEKLKQAGNHEEIYRVPEALHGSLSWTSGFPQVTSAYQAIKSFLMETR